MEPQETANSGEPVINNVTKSSANNTAENSPPAKLPKRALKVGRKYFLYRGRKQCIISAGILIAVGLCRTITSVVMLGLLKKTGYCEVWNKCYMILLESPLGSFECTRPLLTFALMSGWLFEICPGAMLLVGGIQMKKWFYEAFAPLMSISVAVSTFRILAAVVFSFFESQGHVGIYPAVIITAARVYFFWCGYMLKKDIIGERLQAGPAGGYTDIKCNLVSVSFIE